MYEKENPSGTINTNVSIRGYDAYFGTMGVKYYGNTSTSGEVQTYNSSMVPRSIVKDATNCFRLYVSATMPNPTNLKYIEAIFLLSGSTNLYGDDKLFQVITNLNELSIASSYKTYVRLYGIKYN